VEVLQSLICALPAVCPHFLAVPEVVKSFADKELIQKAKSDTNFFSNLAATIGATPLTCDCHGAGKLPFLTLLLSALTFYLSFIPGSYPLL
jgi:hypothetical protein